MRRLQLGVAEGEAFLHTIRATAIRITPTNQSSCQSSAGYRRAEDVLRMCRHRIRVPDQWYGDSMLRTAAPAVGAAAH
jgi:hypothetical protein